MRDQHQRGALFAVEREHQLDDFGPVSVSRLRGWSHRQRRFSDRRKARNGDALLLAAESCFGQMIDAFAQANAGQPVGSTLSASRAPASSRGSIILQRRQRRQQLERLEPPKWIAPCRRFASVLGEQADRLAVRRCRCWGPVDRRAGPAKWFAGPGGADDGSVSPAATSSTRLEDGELAVAQRHHAGERVGTNGRGWDDKVLATGEGVRGGGHGEKVLPQLPTGRSGRPGGYPLVVMMTDRVNGLVPRLLGRRCAGSRHGRRYCWPCWPSNPVAAKPAQILVVGDSLSAG